MEVSRVVAASNSCPPLHANRPALVPHPRPVRAGGNTSAVCAFDPTVAEYDSRGVAVQSFDAPDLTKGPCKDWDTGLPLTCTNKARGGAAG